MKIAVIGGGASGLFFAANTDGDVTVFDKNDMPGKKLLLTGGGRCNLTNDCSVSLFLERVPEGFKFLRSALNGFSSQNAMEWFIKRGLKLKKEKENRVFPISDSAQDVCDLLVKECKARGVKFNLNQKVESIKKENDHFLVNNKKFDKVILALGGSSFSRTGSDGASYSLAKDLGLSVVPVTPALCPLVAKVDKALKGVSVHAAVSVFDNDKLVVSKTGDVLFTHFGLSGPAVLNATAWVKRVTKVSLNFCPEMSEKEVLNMLESYRLSHPKQQVKGLLSRFVPQSVASVLTKGVPQKLAADLSKAELISIAKLLTNYAFSAKLSGMDMAMITSGGVDTNQVNPKTMECKNIAGLYVIGEALNVHAETGGLNLQIAWSSAMAAARAIGGKNEIYL